jgi:hypothetical protein
MIIERVRARGFGLFESLELELPQHLCVVHGANETGKTTLAEAIFAALYGASDLNGSRRKERHEVARLKPWGGGDFTVAVDVALATGQRLTVVRRLGDRKDDLTVTDRASGEDLVRKGERGAVALNLLTGVSADLFRASVLISDLPIAAIDPQALHERSSNLTASGDETVSVSRALTLIEKQLGEVGRSDQSGQTKIGLAIASRNQLAAQLADITKQRQSTLQDQAAQESAAQLAREQEAALQEARRQQAAIRRWVATERLGALTANRARIEELEQELKPLAALAQIDPKAAEGLKATIAAARTAASQEQERAQSLRQQAAAEPKPPPASPEWVDRAWQELNRPKLAPSPRGAWWPWLASIVLVVAAAALFASGQPAGGAAALVAAVALLAWSRLARPGTTSGSSQQSALAAEAGASELTVDLVRRVETAWATWRRDQESRETWMADAERLEASAQARLELARRYLHSYEPATPEAFGQWAGTGRRYGTAAFDVLRPSLTPVRTPIGDAWLLAQDEAACRERGGVAAPARLLPSGDPFWLLQGSDRELLVPNAAHRDALWTPRVRPGALLVGGEIAGTWRRAGADLTIQPWRRLVRSERDAVAAEAQSLPLPGIAGRLTIRWED